MTNTQCISIMNRIIATADTLTLDDAEAIMNHARLDDPTESLHAAHIRDAIRDNTELELS